MKGRGPSPGASYGLLLFGALAQLMLFALRSRIWEFIDPFPRLLLFLAWIAAPTALLAFNTFAVRRWLLRGGGGGMFLSGTLLYLGSGAIIYWRAFVIPAEEVMEVTFLFLFGPLYLCAAAALVSAGYLVRGLQFGLRRKNRDSSEATR